MSQILELTIGEYTPAPENPDSYTHLRITGPDMEPVETLWLDESLPDFLQLVGDLGQVDQPADCLQVALWWELTSLQDVLAHLENPPAFQWEGAPKPHYPGSREWFVAEKSVYAGNPALTEHLGQLFVHIALLDEGDIRAEIVFWPNSQGDKLTTARPEDWEALAQYLPQAAWPREVFPAGSSPEACDGDQELRACIGVAADKLRQSI